MEAVFWRLVEDVYVYWVRVGRLGDSHIGHM